MRAGILLHCLGSRGKEIYSTFNFEDPEDKVKYTKIVEQLDPPKVTITPQELEGDISTVRDSDYADKVDTLVGNMVAHDDNVFTHDSEGC